MASSKGTDGSGGSAERRWAIARVALGLLQMFGASLSVVLLHTTGASPVALTAVAPTGLYATVSVLVRPVSGL